MKDRLKNYLQQARDVMLWKLEGVSEYDIRRPMVPTGTNLLGLVKHVATVDAGYFGETFGRPFPGGFAWNSDDAEPSSDLWATADESREFIVDLYQRVWKHSDETIDMLDLDALGTVPWWSPETATTSLHRIMVHMIAETNRHAGHADILRELIDGSVGHRAENDNLDDNGGSWEAYRAKLEAIARAAR
jgi:hypothetical protein